MSEFMFIYRGPAGASTADNASEVTQRWIAWIQKLGTDGHLVDRGQPLESTGKVVSGKDNIVTDGPYAETKDLISGYTLIDAEDLDQAAELSAGCPIFDIDGLVEIRPIVKLMP